MSDSVSVVYVHGPSSVSGIETPCQSVQGPNCCDFNACFSEISNFTMIQFQTAEVYLRRELVFTGQKDIAFVGSNSGTKLVCLQNGGLTFNAVENLCISGLLISNCGHVWASSTMITFDSATALTSSSVVIFNSTNVFLLGVHIANSNGSGIAIVNTDGRVTIENCKFNENKMNGSAELLGGGGVYIEFSDENSSNVTEGLKFTHNSVYTIKNCTFSGNIASSIYSSLGTIYGSSNTSFFRGLGKGGGLAVFMRGHAESNNITLLNCTFENNSAVWGGGMIATFHDFVRGNAVVMQDCHFRGNTAYKINGSVDGGGGGALVGYQFQNTEHHPNHNVIRFENCSFVGNIAFSTGGGVNFISGYTNSIDAQNQLYFVNCSWIGNFGRYGSAVDISPHRWLILGVGYLPIPLFENCEFTGNLVTDNDYHFGRFWDVKLRGNGALLATVFSIRFAGKTNFTNNNGSAIFAMSTILDFSEGSIVVFLNNSGSHGGAIALIGFSGVQVRDNTMFTFKNNSAFVSGGAIYHRSIDKHDFISSRSCFIQYVGYSSFEDRNVHFLFDGNYAKQLLHVSSHYALGRSIFATTIFSCAHRCTDSQLPRVLEYNDVFKCIGNYEFKDSQKYEISTRGIFIMAEDIVLEAIPGRDIVLPFNNTDNTGVAVNEVYHTTVGNIGNSDIKVDEAHSYFSSERIKLFGKPNDTARISLAQTGFTDIAVGLNVRMLECPPGFVLITDRSNSLQLKRCICSTDTRYNFSGVLYCNHTLFQAYILHGYWFGYDKGYEMQENLLSSYCPPGYCFQDERIDNFHALTNRASHEALDNLVCGKRSGIICGTCKEGLSVYYLSEFFSCKTNTKCHLGWLFYILSDIVPVTVLFLVVIFFNVSFTSGAANGFIFFAQVIDSLSVTGSGFIILQRGSYKTARALRTIYKFFNFDFFNADNLSFCLWKGATTLDILMFKFVTVSYAFLLVLVTILCMKMFNVYKRCPCLKQSSIQSSLIHGLSAFLVMCYAQCTKVAIQILDPVHLYSQGQQANRTVVFFQGNIGHMQVEHLPYAIPALFFISTLVLIPPLILMCYPYYKKLFSYCNLDETKLLRYGSKVLPIERMKPLIDAFQGCFKDNYRFFAGLQFVYRGTILSSVFFSNVKVIYSLFEIQLIAMLLIHATAQPYKKRWHNIVDAFILFDLALINKMTMFSYDYNKADKHLIEGVGIVQIVLILLPLLYMIAYISVCIVAKVHQLCWKRKTSEDTHLELDIFPARLMDTEDSSEFDVDYNLHDGVNISGLFKYTD